MKRWIGEAGDELGEILADEERELEEKQSVSHKKERQQHKKKNESYKKERQQYKKDNRSYKTGELLTGNTESYMLFAAMPLKVIKNQEFCIDFCLFPEKE